MGKDIKLSSGRVLVGDCVARMRNLPDNSIDSIVTDPPYGLEFMGKEWDSFKTGRSAKYAKGGDLDRDAMAERSGKGGAGPSYVNRPAKRCADCGKQAWSGSPCKCDKPRWVLDNSPLHAFQAWFEVVAAEAFRVLKPGGHLLAFGGTRTYHRMACAIEDAGFEIRDSIHWVYGSGFPKSLNIGKAIDKRGGSIPWQAEFAEHLRAVKPKDVTAAQINAHVATNGSKSNFWGHFIDVTSQPLLPTVEQYRRLRELLPIDPVWDEQFLPEAEREVVGRGTSGVAAAFGDGRWATIEERKQSGSSDYDVTAPATEEAARWEGWGTALKPAHEPVVVARKPLSGTVAGNVLVWGTGGLNIDGCRVGTDGGTARDGKGNAPNESGWENMRGHGIREMNAGRWPANIVLDETAAAALDQQSGVSKGTERVGHPGGNTFGGSEMRAEQGRWYGGEGGASRFFTRADFGPNDWPFVYQAKPSKAERNAGLDGLPQIVGKRTQSGGDDTRGRPTPVNSNHHPTVKPVALMRHLVRLVTPPGGTVLDPFLGSGTTAVAATLEGFRWIGCEMTDDYLPIIKGRVAWAEGEVKAGRADKPQYKKPAPAKPKPAQPTLEDGQQQ
jgi:DNA modification methylase